MRELDPGQRFAFSRPVVLHVGGYVGSGVGAGMS